MIPYSSGKSWNVQSYTLKDYKNGKDLFERSEGLRTLCLQDVAYH